VKNTVIVCAVALLVLLPVVLASGCLSMLAPPATGRIAFHSDRVPSPRGIAAINLEIYVMDANGTNQRNLTNNPDSDDWYHVWSPDGSRLAFERDIVIVTRTLPFVWNPEIYVVDADGSNQTRLTDNLAKDQYPTWSPDGSGLAFESDRDGNTEIYVMDADGSNQRNLTNNPGWDWAPAWSPDGSGLAFESNRDGNTEIYVMDADGSNQRNLTGNPGRDSNPVWSP
jgi:Tol biopolymer transport system component